MNIVTKWLRTMGAVQFCVTLILFAERADAQRSFDNLSPDSAWRLIHTGKTAEERYTGYYCLDRNYYTTAQYDSSRLMQKEMYGLAKGLNRDSLLADTYHSIGNMLVHKSDFNYALTSYFKALEYAKDEYRRARSYAAAGYVYILNGNAQLGYTYVRKADSLSSHPYMKKIANIYSGAAYNSLKKPDSAIIFLHRAEADGLPVEPILNSVLLGQMALSYELSGDNDLAEAYYKKALAYAKTKKLQSSYIRAANHYCNYLLNLGRYKDGKRLAIDILKLARNVMSNDGISNVAESLKKIYYRENNKDSAFYYAEMQIAYKDSINNQKTIAELQNITFVQQLRDIDEQTKVVEEAGQRKENLSYAMTALGIVVFVILFLLLSRRVISNAKAIISLGVVALLLVFEFFNLLLHPFLEAITQHSPALMLLSLVAIAALLVPIHNKAEKWATHQLVEKNRQVRLTAARKTIERLEKERGTV
ncbi:MAG TPA: hypothetical protein VFE32_02530 [Puia sp.]|jgi:hypothetical protein|nr:hypothetical protein [Puia sp.]